MGRFFVLIDKISDCSGVFLGCTKNDRFLGLIGVIHINLYTCSFSFPDLDDPVKVLFLVNSALFNFSFEHLVITGVNIIVEGGLNSFHFEWGKKSVVDTLFE